MTEKYRESPCWKCAPYPGCSDGCRIVEEWRKAGERDKAFQILLEFYNELKRAESLHGPMITPHHGLSVIRGEVKELEDEVNAEKTDNMNPNMREEAIHVGAMALRFIKDLG